MATEYATNFDDLSLEEIEGCRAICASCRGRQKRTGLKLLLGGIAALGTYMFVIRPWHTKWGAMEDEIEGPLPGDDIVPKTTYVTTRAITIDAKPEDIWPWLEQIGEGRGGFYSYDWIENLMGMKIHSADEILPEHFHLKGGDVVPAGKEGIPVIDVRENQFLLLGSEKPLSWGQSTWCIALLPVGQNKTRVVSRVRAHVRATPVGAFWLMLLDPGQFLMERKMLLGLKKRVERLRNLAA